MEKYDLDLVAVWETEDSFALSLAKAALADAGIEYMVSGDDGRYLAGFPGAFGVGETPLGSRCACSIQVAREFESAARVLLHPLK